MEAPTEANRSIKFSDLAMEDHIIYEESPDSRGNVFEVVDRFTGSSYILKECNIQCDSLDRAELSREIAMLKNLNHPNILKCQEVFDFGNRVYLLLEHMDCGSIIGVDFTSESTLAIFAHQVLLGLRYLHQNNISHGDIKLSNIFVNTREQVKILYSGKILSKRVDSSEPGGIFDRFSWDVHCVALCILDLFKGLNWWYKVWGLNWGDGDEVTSLEELPTPPENEGVPVQKPSIELCRFFLCCTQTEKNVPKRRTAEELVHHPFLEQVSASSSKEKRAFSALSYEGKEQISPQTKRPKVSVEVVPGIYDLESTQDHTQVHFERCIQHCALFFPDCEFEKDKLVQMWIAEECVEFKVRKRVEDVVNLYFDALVHREVIMPSKFDHLYGRIKYKVNTSKAPSWFPKPGDYIRIDEGNWDKFCKDALHLTWHCKSLDRTLFDALKSFKELRTLRVVEYCSPLIKQLPNDIFVGLKLLKTLDLSGTLISELPSSIGLLESLRLLDVSKTPIKQLPDSTHHLCLLQTLKLRDCFGLSALPKGLGWLIDLRHLDLNIFGQLESMPKGMGNLINLQTLPAFIVGKNDRCGIGELKNMNEITGSFCISGLENVSSAEEAKEAALGDKQHIYELELRWCALENDNSQVEILECLQPHFQLKELTIIFYGGSKLPSWISNPFFTDLTSITLYRCINCDILPSIGELPSLKILHIVGMKNVRDINTVFYRNYGTEGFNAFPKLEKLTLQEMLNLEEWTGIEDGDFPCLCHISIEYCPKLFVLPSLSHLHSLQHLEIYDCMQLISLPKLSGPLEYLIINKCPKIVDWWSNDGGQVIAGDNIWIDFEKITLD